MKLYDDFRAWTATNMFILPTLGMDRGRLKNIGMLNAYIRDELHEEYKGGIYVLFRPKDEFDSFLEECRRKKMIIDEYDYPGGFVIVVFKYPISIENDVELIMKGQFSKTSIPYRNMITKTYRVDEMGRAKEYLTIQHQIFSKSQSIIDYWWDKYQITFDKEDEVWEFNFNKEIFNLETLKQYEHTKQVY